MSHDWNCPTGYEARQKARYDAEYDRGYGGSYRTPYDCDEANDAYRREYLFREEERAEEQRAERRRQARMEEERMQEEQWAYEQQCQAEQAAMYDTMEEQFHQQYAAQIEAAHRDNDQSPKGEDGTASSQSDAGVDPSGYRPKEGL